MTKRHRGYDSVIVFSALLSCCLANGSALVQVAAGDRAIDYASHGTGALVDALLKCRSMKSYSQNRGEDVGIMWGPIMRLVPKVAKPTIIPLDYRQGEAGILLGQIRFAIIVNSRNPVKSLSLPQLKGLFRESAKEHLWSEYGGRGTAVVCLASCGNDILKESLSRLLLLEVKNREGAWYPFAKAMKSDSTENVIKEVSKKTNAIGVIPVPVALPSNVRAISVSVRAESRATAVDLALAIQTSYPLLENVVLLLPAGTERFADLAKTLQREDAAKVCKELGLITHWEQREAEVSARFAETQSGKGVRLSCVGIAAGLGAFRGLAVEFVRAKEVVQLAYGSLYSDAACVGSFVGGGGKQELLVLGDRPSGRAMELHGKKCIRGIRGTPYSIVGLSFGFRAGSLGGQVAA